LFLSLVLIPGVVFHLGRIVYDLIFRRENNSDERIRISRAKGERALFGYRLSFLYFWLPAAIAVFFFGAKLAEIVGLGQFRI
jgi:hypothetical protein